MTEHENLNNIELGEFEKVTDLLSSSYEMQIAFISIIIGLSVLFVVYNKFSSWIGSKKISYTRPHLSRFIQTVLLPVFAIVLVSTVSSYVQLSILSSETIMIDSVNDDKKTGDEAKAIFSKILATINVIMSLGLLYLE